jgi:Predicted transcriptional regulators
MILSLDFSSDIPIYMQIRNQIIVGISNGTLAPGEKLPTIRNLAQEIGINAMTVNKAYQLLKQEGYIIADRRNGAMVKQVFNTSKQLSQKTAASLRMVISEAKLNGFTEDDILQICNELYHSNDPA